MMDHVYYKEIGEGNFILVNKIREMESYYLSKMTIGVQDLESLARKNKARRLEWLAVRYALSKQYDQAFMEIYYDENGKPYFTYMPDKELSISHSFNKIAIYVSDSQVGLDIQFLTDKVVKVQKKFLHKSEMSYLGEVDRLRKLNIIWAAKESLYKHYSKKNLSFKDQIWIDEFEISGSRFLIDGHYQIDEIIRDVSLNVILFEDDVLVFTI